MQQINLHIPIIAAAMTALFIGAKYGWYLYIEHQESSRRKEVKAIEDRTR